MANKPPKKGEQERGGEGGRERRPGEGGQEERPDKGSPAGEDIERDVEQPAEGRTDAGGGAEEPEE